MLATHPDSTGPRLTRRDGLIGLAVLGPVGLLAACSGSSDSGPQTPSPSAATISSSVAAQEQRLVARYDDVMTRFPELAAALQPIREQHAQHALALDPDSGEQVAPSPTEAPETEQEAIAGLIAAERRASRQRIDACVEADEPGLARLLTFIAASEASHVPALKDVRA